MPLDKFASADTKHITEGRFDEVMLARVTHEHGARSVPTFVRMVVLDVISDPTTVDKVKLSHYQHDLGVSNSAYASVAPRNSIIARPLMGKGAGGASDKVMVLFPFFPPHISLPCKPGEHVWAIFEQPDAKVSEIGYWMCRIVGPDFVEDVNYTHMDRQFDRTFLPGLSDVFEGTDAPIYEFRNGAVDSKNGQRFTIPETSSLPGDETAYEKLLTTSDACQITRYEAVPRYRKRPADTVFEGSNNTLIVLGTDRTTAYADTTSKDPTLGTVPKPLTADIFDDGAGSIDIVAGRGQTSDTSGTPEASNLIAGGASGHKELGKSHKDLAPKEGDIDLIHDRSRVLVAQKTAADVNFGIDTYLSKLVSGTTTDGAATSGAIVAKSDKVRIIGRNDIALITTSQASTDSNGLPQDNTDTTKWCIVALKSNGDVYVQPVTGQAFDIQTQKCSVKINADNVDIKIGATEFNVKDGLVAVTTDKMTMSKQVNMGALSGPNAGALVLNIPMQAVITDIYNALQAISMAMQTAVGNMGVPIPSLVAASVQLTTLLTKLQTDAQQLPTQTTQAT